MNERSIFLEALDRADPVQRAEYLQTACGENQALRERVEQLLRAHVDAGDFLEQPPAELQETLQLGQDPDSETVEAELVADSLSFLEPCDKPDRIGRLRAYEVIEVLGRGGMGLVLRAVDVRLNRVVAIKVMAPELAANAMARQRFLREAQAAAAIAHPHVVTIHAVDDYQRLPFIVMECVEGRTLQDKIDAGGALELKELLRIAAQTASGLAAAHRQGIVHRDVKPGNVLLENGIERVKLTDFGLARAVDDVNITQTGQITGTPQYMSPEQAEGKPIDYRSDLFSLGSVMYAMATGRPAFRAESALAVLRRVCDDTPRPIREINPAMPAWLIDIIDRLMAKDPDRRIQTAEEVEDLLHQNLAHLQHPTLAPRPVPPPPVRHVATSPERPSKIAQVHPRRPLRRWIIALSLLAFVILVTVGGVIGLARRASPLADTQGTLVVDVEDPDLMVVINRDGRLLHIDAGGREYMLDPGYYEISISSMRSSRPISYRETIFISPGVYYVFRKSFDSLEPSLPTFLLQTGATQSPEGPRFDGWGAALSPDGTRVVYQTAPVGVSPTDDLILQDIETGEQISLIKGGKDPAWSPRTDGPIAFVMNREDVEEIWCVEPDGTSARKVVDGGFPGWSADGATLYHYHRPSAELRSLNIDDPAAQPRKVMANPGTMYPAVSPDESMVAVHQVPHLVVIEIGTNRQIAKVLLPGWHGMLSGWSPDSRYLGFGSYATRDDGLCVLDLQAGEARQVLLGPLTMPRWSADGKRVTFDDRRKKVVWVVEAEFLGLQQPTAKTPVTDD